MSKDYQGDDWDSTESAETRFFLGGTVAVVLLLSGQDGGWTMKRTRTILVCALVMGVIAAQLRANAPAVHFSRDILPILSQNCFQCHGPDEKARKAKLRLDQRDGARKVVVPGKSAESELIRRITADDPEERMPPPKTNRKLTDAQKDLLRRWIDQGAVWQKHWAYDMPVRPSLPMIKDRMWPKNGIDHFILSRL